ncbi:MAG: hypothetical protein ABI358_09390 [Ginsengibacter sp.]|jgi:hypothetical protein
MKIEIDDQTITTIGVVFCLLIVECLMPVFKVNYVINISVDIALCIIFNIYNYRRFSNFQTNRDLQLTNRRLAFALVAINLPFLIGIIALFLTR